MFQLSRLERYILCSTVTSQKHSSCHITCYCSTNVIQEHYWTICSNKGTSKPTAA
jgi:hypothetical protein